MTKVEFKKIIQGAFLSNGFRSVEKRLRMDGSFAAVLVNLQKFDYSERYFINVGFWLRGLGDQVPVRVEHTHLYYRLEGLFPAHRETVLDGGDLSLDNQPRLAEQLASVIAGECIPVLAELANSEKAIRDRFARGGFEQGLVRKEARAFLEANSNGSDIKS